MTRPPKSIAPLPTTAPPLPPPPADGTGVPQTYVDKAVATRLAEPAAGQPLSDKYFPMRTLEGYTVGPPDANGKPTIVFDRPALRAVLEAMGVQFATTGSTATTSSNASGSTGSTSSATTTPAPAPVASFVAVPLRNASNLTISGGNSASYTNADGTGAGKADTAMFFPAGAVGILQWTRDTAGGLAVIVTKTAGTHDLYESNLYSVRKSANGNRVFVEYHAADGSGGTQYDGPNPLPTSANTLEQIKVDDVAGKLAYRYSIDNGATWAAWQDETGKWAGASYISLKGDENPSSVTNLQAQNAQA